MPPTDQPSSVRTKDAPRPPDDSVVTDELKESGLSDAAAAALGPDKGRTNKGSKDRQSADGKPNQDDPNQDTRRDRHAEKRIRRLTRQLAAERDRNNANDQRIARLETELTGLKTRSTATPPKEPDLKDFKDPKEYAKAYAKWEREVEAAKGAPDKKRADGDGQPPARTTERRAEPKGPDEEQLEKFFKDGKKKLGDEFLMAQEAAAAKEFAVSQVMGDFILDSEHGHEIFVYLADHPKLSRRIFDKSETFAVKELEALEEKAKAGELIDEGLHGDDDEDDDAGDTKRDRKGRFKSKGDDDEDGGDEDDDERGGTETRGDGSHRERRQTRAPKPPETGGKERGGGGRTVDLESAGMDDYAAARAKEEAARLKRH